MKRAVVMATIFMFLLPIAAYASDIQSICGSWLRQAMDAGRKVQEQKQRLRDVELRIQNLQAEYRRVHGEWAIKMNTARQSDLQKWVQLTAQWNEIEERYDKQFYSLRANRENAKLFINKFEKDYEIKANKFADCVEKYKATLRDKKLRASTQAERREIDAQISDSDGWIKFALGQLKW